jgi:DNA repair protein RadA/Sms
MARPRQIYACSECAAQHAQWHGRCPECGAWSTLVEETVGGNANAGANLLAAAATARTAKVRSLKNITTDATPRIATGIAELDRVLGGGLVPASVVLIGGEPGVGKSTLALQLAAGLERHGTFLYVTGEESPEQVRLRAQRLPNMPEEMLVLAETRVEAIAGPWRERDPRVVLIDSIQAVRSDRSESAPGSVAQVRECAAMLSATAKVHGAALILIGHVTKEGNLAGPRVLEHLVDVVLNFEGDRSQAFRLLRAVKNRFGSTDEVGVFTMGPAGLEGVANPSELLLAERQVGTPGSCIVPIVEGTRPMLVELQALVAPAGYGTARRTSLGIDDGRLALLIAALDRRSDVDLVANDIYVNVAGGVRIAEPGADLALALALASSRLDIALPPDVAACGEIGLGGEVRRVSRIDLRLREAVRLGFRRVLVPAGAIEAARVPQDAQVIPVADVGAAIAWLRAQTPGNTP